MSVFISAYWIFDICFYRVIFFIVLTKWKFTVTLFTKNRAIILDNCWHLLGICFQNFGYKIWENGAANSFSSQEMQWIWAFFCTKCDRITTISIICGGGFCLGFSICKNSELAVLIYCLCACQTKLSTLVFLYFRSF